MRSDNALNQFLTELHRKPPVLLPEPPKRAMSLIELLNEATRSMGTKALVGTKFRIKLPSTSWRKL